MDKIRTAEWKKTNVSKQVANDNRQVAQTDQQRHRKKTTIIPKCM